MSCSLEIVGVRGQEGGLCLPICPVIVPKLRLGTPVCGGGPSLGITLRQRISVVLYSRQLSELNTNNW